MDFDKSQDSLQAKLEQIRIVLKSIGKGEKVSGIDLDLAKVNMVQIYEHLLNHRSEHQGQPLHTIVEELKKPVDPPVKTKKEKPIALLPDPVIVLSSAAEDNMLTIETETNTGKPVKMEIPGRTQGKTREIIGEKFQDNKKLLNEAHNERSHKNQKDLSSVMQSKPIQSIESAIGINDKFLFIKELFNGNAQQYKETLEQLNNSADFNTAVQYMEQQFNWEMESEAVMKLLDLLRRRYISHNNG
jgi:hypothetical protein